MFFFDSVIKRQPQLMALVSAFTFSSRAALRLRNVKLKLKSAATTSPLAPLCCRCTIYSTHTQWLQLSSYLSHHLLHCLLTLLLSSFGEWLRENLDSNNKCIPPFLLFREYGQHSCGTALVLGFSGSVGCVVRENPLRTEAWVGVGDTAARNWGTQSWLVHLAAHVGFLHF